MRSGLTLGWSFQMANRHDAIEISSPQPWFRLKTKQSRFPRSSRSFRRRCWWPSETANGRADQVSRDGANLETTIANRNLLTLSRLVVFSRQIRENRRLCTSFCNRSFDARGERVGGTIAEACAQSTVFRSEEKFTMTELNALR